MSFDVERARLGKLIDEGADYEVILKQSQIVDLEHNKLLRKGELN